MRCISVVMLLALAAGCSSTEKPQPERPLSADEIGAMPSIALAELTGRLEQPGGKALVLVLWRGDTEAAQTTLAAADELAARHAKAGLDVLALNIDPPDDVRRKALPLLGKLAPKALEPRSYQDDVMGLGIVLDAHWGGQTPAVFVYDRKGKQVYQGHGADALGQAAAAVPAALARR